MSGSGKLRGMTDRNAKIVEFYLYLAAFVTVRQLIQRARRRYRWDTRRPPSGSGDTYCRVSPSATTRGRRGTAPWSRPRTRWTRRPTG
jgi:hypothetical protein